MYFWNYKKLIQALKEDQISAKQELTYFLIVTALFYLAAPGLSETKGLINDDLILLLGTIVITIGGIAACYLHNREYDDKEFIKRFICLALPLNVRFTIFFIIPLLIVLFSIEGIELLDSIKFNLFFELVFWIYVANAFEKFNQTEQEIDEDTLINCKFCAETIKKDAIFCKHCQKDLV